MDFTNKIRFSSYWRNYSRILSFENGVYVEVDLTAINPTWSSEWDRVDTINIRQHRTAVEDREILDELPSSVRLMMVAWLGEEKTEELLTADFLSVIDWEKYKKHNNGGASFYKIKKEEL